MFTHFSEKNISQLTENVTFPYFECLKFGMLHFIIIYDCTNPYYFHANIHCGGYI